MRVSALHAPAPALLPPLLTILLLLIGLGFADRGQVQWVRWGNSAGVSEWRAPPVNHTQSSSSLAEYHGIAFFVWVCIASALYWR